jgi:hypothetical protein
VSRLSLRATIKAQSPRDGARVGRALHGRAAFFPRGSRAPSFTTAALSGLRCQHRHRRRSIDLGDTARADRFPARASGGRAGRRSGQRLRRRSHTAHVQGVESPELPGARASSPAAPLRAADARLALARAQLCPPPPGVRVPCLRVVDARVDEHQLPQARPPQRRARATRPAYALPAATAQDCRGGGQLARRALARRSVLPDELLPLVAVA